MKPSRRALLGAGLALPALPLAAAARPKAPRAGGAPPAAPVGPAVPPVAAADSSFDPWLEVSEANLRHNVGEIARRTGGRPILAVIKNNGYGAGVVNVGRVLETLPAVAATCVIKLAEAMALRDAGLRKPILLLGPFDEQNLEDALSRDVMPMVYTPVGPALERIAGKLGRPVGIHVCVDTGIGRVGVPARDAAPLLRDLAARKGVRLEGVMTTFTEDAAFDVEQQARFTALCDGLAREGLALGRRHVATSFALFQHPDSYLDAVRPGLAVFGVYPEPGFRKLGVMDLRPVTALRCRVAFVKKLRPGDSAGYNRAFRPKVDTWLATLPVGHADGWPREAVRGARVRIRGRLFPCVGKVSSSHTLVELGPERAGVEIGDVATLFDGADGTRPDDQEAACGASAYDIVMHASPSLPRRILAG